MRTCTNCGQTMVEGYCCGDGEEYYCSDVCLYADGYTPKQHKLDYESGGIYWTEWKDEAEVHDLASTLAEHRTEAVELEELMQLYYDNQFDILSTYSAEELAEMIDQEIN